PMLDLPQPLGPTTAVIPSGKITSVRSPKDLKPTISIFSSFSMEAYPRGRSKPAPGIYHHSRSDGWAIPLGARDRRTPKYGAPLLDSAVAEDQQVGDGGQSAARRRVLERGQLGRGGGGVFARPRPGALERP